MRADIIRSAVKGAVSCNKAIRTAKRAFGKKYCCKKHSAACCKREDVIIMKKSTLLAWVAFFSAIAGALAAAYFYIQRREKELEEYEQLLFSEDFCEEAPIDEIGDAYADAIADEADTEV